MELREYQKELVKQAKHILDCRGIVYVAAECRVGKTPTALAIADEVRCGGRVLWLTPKAAISSILDDSRGYSWAKDFLTICNRESIHKIGEGPYSVIVADESHRDGAYPKPSKTVQAMSEMAHGAKIILLSGTPSVETGAQLYHQFWWSGKGPWASYRKFYDWHRTKGIPAKKKVGAGLETNDYSKVLPCVVDEVKDFVVTLTQAEAGFQHAPKLIPHLLQKPADLAGFQRAFWKTGIAELGERTVVAENIAAKLQKLHMSEGGTLVDDQERAFDHGMDSHYKVRYVAKKMERGKEYAIFTAYIAERELIIDYLIDHGFTIATELAEFKSGCGKIFVGSGLANAEGVDLAWMTGDMIIYSLNWSGAKFCQLLERQNNFRRDRPINVHVLLCCGGIDERVFEALSQKKNFNAGFYHKAKK